MTDIEVAAAMGEPHGKHVSYRLRSGHGGPVGFLQGPELDLLHIHCQFSSKVFK